jgi:hypothetical protein
VNGSVQWVIELDTVLYAHPGICVIRGDGSKAYGGLANVAPPMRRKLLCENAARVYEVPMSSRH